MLAQGARVRVALVAAPDLAHVGLVAGVHVRVLLPVAAVGKPPVAALELAFKRFFTYRRAKREMLRVKTRLFRGPSRALTISLSLFLCGRCTRK